MVETSLYFQKRLIIDIMANQPTPPPNALTYPPRNTGFNKALLRDDPPRRFFWPPIFMATIVASHLDDLVVALEIRFNTNLVVFLAAKRVAKND